jgi:hypothetical protein
MAKKKLTKAEKAVAEAMLALVEWASGNPGQWCSLGQEEATKRAAALLEKRGVIHVNVITNVYRLKSPK